MTAPAATVETAPNASAERLLSAGGIALAAAAMAPALAVVLNAPAAAPAAGGALPLAFLLAFLACLLVGNTVISFAPPVAAVGRFFVTRTTRAGWARPAGFATGWLLAFGYAVLAPGLSPRWATSRGLCSHLLGRRCPVVVFQSRGIGRGDGPVAAKHPASVRVDLVCWSSRWACSCYCRDRGVPRGRRAERSRASPFLRFANPAVRGRGGCRVRHPVVISVRCRGHAR